MKVNREFKGKALAYCQYCGRTGVPIGRHHIKKRSQGGTNSPKNRIDLCERIPDECHLKADGYVEGYEPKVLYWKAWEDKKRRKRITVLLS